MFIKHNCFQRRLFEGKHILRISSANFIYFIPLSLDRPVLNITMPVDTISTENVPADFFCPITCEMMKDPLMTRSGQNYERRAILEWLQKHNNTCPLTRQPLRLSDLLPNAALRSRIQAWCSVYSVPMGLERSPSTSYADDDDDDDVDDISKDILLTCMVSDIFQKSALVRLEANDPCPEGSTSSSPASRRRFKFFRFRRVLSSQC